MPNVDKIDRFDGEYAFLSNFHPSIVALHGILDDPNTYPTVENAYQAAKSLDQHIRDRFVHMMPGEAKRNGRLVKLRPDWEDIKMSVMEQLVVQKFTLYNDLRDQLAATGDAMLIEGNNWGDNYWGVDYRTPEKGQNRLGIILMAVRHRILEGRRTDVR